MEYLLPTDTPSDRLIAGDEKFLVLTSTHLGGETDVNKVTTVLLNVLLKSDSIGALTFGKLNAW